MGARNIGALLVLEAGKLIGIITERDFSRNVRILDKPLRDVQVEEIMTSKVAYVGPDNTTEDCMKLVTKMRIRHLPVMDNDQLIGIISIGDLVKDSIAGRAFEEWLLTRNTWRFLGLSVSLLRISTLLTTNTGGGDSTLRHT